MSKRRSFLCALTLTSPLTVVTFSQAQGVANEAIGDGVSGAAQTPRASNSKAMPGAQMPSGSSAPAPESTYGTQLKLGNYVELDAAIRNEMYGTIDFPNAELKDIIKAISKLAGKNFILDRKIEGRRITIVSPVPVTKQEAYNAFLSALYMNELTLVSMGNFLKIIDAKSALQSNIRVFMGDYAPANEEIVTVLYPLKYLNADEIARYLTDLIPRNARISPYPNTNTLVMTDTGLNLRRIIAILKSIDIPGHEDQLETIPIRYASAKQISSLIDDILDAQNGGRGRPPGPPGTRAMAQKTRGGGIITKIVPDERTNSLVVLANGRGVQELKSLIDKLDTPNAAGGGNIHIYYCKNAVAEELATTINALISGTKRDNPASGNLPNQPVAGRPFFPGAPGLGSGALGSPSSMGGDGVKLEGNIKVTADQATNSLVVVASGSDFAALRNVLRKLDIPRRQVYVEATIMEINVTDDKEFGIGTNVTGPGIAQGAGFIPSNLSKEQFQSVISTPAGLNGMVAGIGAGNSVTVAGFSTPIKSVMAFIRAVVDSKQGQILHQPQILTSDNKQAEIKVKESVPTLFTKVIPGTNGGAPTTTDEPTRNDIEISLKIKPQLGEGSDLIRLEVEQSVEDFFQVAEAKKAPYITTRSANTMVVARDGDTVVIGGLQKSLSNESRSKFPLLGDLPIVGWLFKGMTSKIQRSNLILFLTPRIITQYNDLLKITSKKLEDRHQLGKKQFEPEDAHRKELQAMRDENEKNLKKPAPKVWGFKPKGGVTDSFDVPLDPVDSETADASASQVPPAPVSANLLGTTPGSVNVPNGMPYGTGLPNPDPATTTPPTINTQPLVR